MWEALDFCTDSENKVKYKVVHIFLLPTESSLNTYHIEILPDCPAQSVHKSANSPTSYLITQQQPIARSYNALRL